VNGEILRDVRQARPYLCHDGTSDAPGSCVESVFPPTGMKKTDMGALPGRNSAPLSDSDARRDPEIGPVNCPGA
jgi:hypothetical protein